MIRTALRHAGRFFVYTERMKSLIYATGSKAKFEYVVKLLADVPLVLEQRKVDVDEIQSDVPEKIAERKARDAFATIREPLFVTDTFWAIPALNGFPGAYMKDVNQWLSAGDFLKLMEGKEDRRIIAKDVITYTDGTTTKQFTIELEGSFATTPWDGSSNALDSVAQFEGKYLGQIKAEGAVIGDENAKWAQFKDFLRTL